VRELLHIVGVLLVLPITAVASVYALLGRAIARRSLFGLVDQLATDAAWVMPWGILGALALVLALLVAGLLAKSRALAGLCVALLGIGSTVYVVAVSIMHSDGSWARSLVLLPGLLGAGIGVWQMRAPPRGALPSPPVR
jgi:cellobiose-specific phosphotransferase system component IIC